MQHGKAWKCPIFQCKMTTHIKCFLHHHLHENQYVFIIGYLVYNQSSLAVCLVRGKWRGREARESFFNFTGLKIWEGRGNKEAQFPRLLFVSPSILGVLDSKWFIILELSRLNCPQILFYLSSPPLLLISVSILSLFSLPSTSLKSHLSSPSLPSTKHTVKNRINKEINKQTTK